MDINFFKTTRILDGGMGQELLARGMKTNGTLWSANAVLKEEYHQLLLDTHLDFINGQKNFLSQSIYNLNPKLGDLLIFPNYLMHTAYPFNVDGERRSFSFNAKILFKK